MTSARTIGPARTAGPARTTGPVRTVRPTSRGWVLGIAGLATTVAGVLLGVRLLVQLGAVPTSAVLAGLGWMALSPAVRDGHRVRVERSVVPRPVAVGHRAVVRVDVTRGRTGQRLDRWQVSERAARELSGPLGLRARVRREPGRLRLTYTIEPRRRGRWTVGPLEVRNRDVFGLVSARGPVGAPTVVTVHPAVVTLDLTDRAIATDVSRVTLGSRTPSADDTLLREYRTGDDLRRVHWRSSARRGSLVVRQDERAGRRPATVLLDLPSQQPDAEWTISMAASMGLALVRSGHRVRLLGDDLTEPVPGTPPGTAGHSTAEALLDRTVDLHLPPSATVRTARLLGAIDQLTTGPVGAELVMAVIGPLEPAELTSLAKVGAAHRCWAMVRTGAHDTRAGTTHDQERTVAALNRAGWTACAVRAGEPLDAAWDRLRGSDHRWEAAR